MSGARHAEITASSSNGFEVAEVVPGFPHVRTCYWTRTRKRRLNSRVTPLSAAAKLPPGFTRT